MQTDLIAKKLAQTCLDANHYVEGGAETLPNHIAKLQRLREACRGLGIEITDAKFTGVITLSMPMPFWDPVIGSLGGVLDSMTVISHLITEWSQMQGHTPTGKGSNVVFQASNRAALKCDNCGKTGHTKARCWGKGGGQEGQYPEWFK